jgi:hypothetical protein
LNVIHAIRGRVNISNTAAQPTAGVQIGTMPAGAFVKSATAHVITAFNGTGATVDVGTAATLGAFAPSASVVPGTAGYKPNLTGTGMGDTLTADTPIVVKVAAGTGGTTGDVSILVEFYPQQS